MGIRVGRAVAAALAAAALIIIASAVAAAPSCVSRAVFSVRYHFVCYKSADDAHTAASVSSVVQSHGGAGYIVKTGDDYRVAAGCYYSAEDARKVCSALSDSGLACDAVEAGVDGYDLPRDLAPQADAVCPRSCTAPPAQGVSPETRRSSGSASPSTASAAPRASWSVTPESTVRRGGAHRGKNSASTRRYGF